MSINKVLISGNLTRDPELRATATGMPVLGLGVAVNDRRKNQSTGEWEDYPNFIDCTLFGSRAESVSNYLNKGSKVAIEGKLRWSQWERDGQKRSKVEVIIDEIEFLSSRSSATSLPQPPITEPTIPDRPELTVYDEDIPF
jgi:single-strand DNA-binding protein